MSVNVGAEGDGNVGVVFGESDAPGRVPVDLGVQLDKENPAAMNKLSTVVKSFDVFKEIPPGAIDWFYGDPTSRSRNPGLRSPRAMTATRFFRSHPDPQH